VDRQGTCRHPFEHDCFPSPRTEAKTISACSAGTRLSASCIALDARSIETNSHSKVQRSLRFGPDTHRPTKDLDLLGRGLPSTITEVEALIREICEVRQDDGIVFDDESIEGSRIKEDDEYDGVRIKFQAELAGARIPMQVDIGFGDAVYPEPELASFPVLLPMEAPIIRAYPREATIAEKFHAMVLLDIRNSRMKDFYDIWYMANTWEFEMKPLQKAIEFSFTRRGTSLPDDVPFALTEGFLDDAQKKTQWNAFVNRLDAGDKRPTLAEVGAVLRSFLLPCISRKSQESGVSWNPTHHWR
jgi:Nucleotidyl transferase AbiEii toxin, Type IV TA system